jgi:Holliday junction resolvase RusA-like endonuclease
MPDSTAPSIANATYFTPKFGRVLRFEVPGLPEPQGSMRGFKTKSGRVLITSDNRRLSSWRRDAMVAAREMLDETGGGHFENAVWVTLQFVLPRPKGHYGRRGLLPSAPEYPTGAVKDLDKLCRAAFDALTGAGVWRDDGQVIHLKATKAYGEQPCTVVSVGSVNV